jgi:hypothetical protein
LILGLKYNKRKKMKVQAYLTECCGLIKEKHQVVGVSAQDDIIGLKGFPTVFDPEKADIHYCISCYDKLVIQAVNRLVDRNKNEKKYIEILEELSYTLRKSCVYKHFKSLGKH